MIVKHCEPFEGPHADYSDNPVQTFVPDAATLSHLLDAICITDLSWKILFWNEGAQRLFGHAPESVIGCSLQQALPPAFEKHFSHIESTLLTAYCWRSTVRLASPSKSDATTAIDCQFLIDHASNGAPCRILMSSTILPGWSGRERREITQERQAGTENNLFDCHPDGIFTLDAQGNFIAANEAVATLTGYTARELLGTPLPSLLNGTRPRQAMQHILARVFEGNTHCGEFLFRAKSGAVFEAALTLLANIVDKRSIGIHGILRDISLQKEDQRRVLYLANHDVLTGLPNRRLLQSQMQHVLDSARLSGAMVGILFMDLNRFKVVNDSLGHDKGDELLCAVAARLKHAVRPADTVARLGGDEFVVILNTIEDIANVQSIAEKLSHAIRAPIALDDNTVCVTTSIGASVFPDDGDDTTSLLKNADLAMYAAKEEGNGCFRLYAPHMNTRALARLSSENSLREAIAAGHMVLQFQPRLNLQANQIVGVEALVRWDHPEKGLVYPNSFIALAEETGMINALGEWVLTTACKQMAAWRKRGMEPINVSVNMSAIQLKSPQICDMVTAAMATADFDPHLLELEITESSLMTDIDASIETLSRFKQFGISLSIDDFGTGYSSLTYLKRLPISTLKIDRSFVRNLSADKDDAAIVSATIAMAHSMDLKVVAEGVTTFEQLRFLESCQCDEIQGYLVCQPLPAAELESYLRTCDLSGIQYSWVN